MIKNNKFLLINIFIIFNFIVFIDYDFYPFIVCVFALFIIFNKKSIEITKFHKIIIKFQVLSFLVLARFLPVLNEKFYSLWNRIFQSNYLIDDGKIIPETIFGDLQGLLFSISCNLVSDNTISIYKIKYSGNVLSDLFYTCPLNINYPYIFNYFDFDSTHVWGVTLFLSFFTLVFLYFIYLNLSKNINDKNFIVITLFFLSPPINFATQRLNIDVIIFVILYFVYKKENINLAFRLFVVFLLSLLKFYPIVLLFAELVISLISKKIKNVFYVVLAIACSIFYLFNFNSNQNVLNYYLRATESNRAFGILNDAIYISNFINKNLWVSLLLLTILICIFIFLFRNVHCKNVSDTHFAFITMFLGISAFINYDYRAIFLILIIDFLVQKTIERF